MPYFSKEVVEQARQMDLLTYLRNYEPNELVHFAGDTYCTREHDSLKISNGKWYWFSQGVGGVSALDYLIKVQNNTFLEAVSKITGQAAVQPPVSVSKPKDKGPKVLLLPQVKQTATEARYYLAKRGIDPQIIDYCISTGRLYESYPHRNVVFVGRDQEGKARYANLRGIFSDFKGECNGSNKRYSFSIPAQNSANVYVFESAIDLLSYATLRKLNGVDWQKDHLLSLAGVYKPRDSPGESRIPLALEQFLQEHPEIQNIRLRLDNDRTGHRITEVFSVILPNQYTVTAKFPPFGKDYNDYLCIGKGIPVTGAEKSKNRER